MYHVFQTHQLLVKLFTTSADINIYISRQRLLRNAPKPLASEHPSEYGELYSGAAGAPKHWLLAGQAVATPRYRSHPVGAGPSQVGKTSKDKAQYKNTKNTIYI